MRIQLEAREVDVTSAVKDYIQDRVAFHLSRFGGVVDRVTVQLSRADTRGPAPDQHVMLGIALGRLGDVVVEQTRNDLCAAVDQAARQAGRAVRRLVARSRRMERHAVRAARRLSR